jgi:hypothetical protein
MDSKWERYAPLSGVLAVVFWVVGIIIASTQATGSKGPKILISYQDNENWILAAGLIWSIGVILFIWFLGSLRSRLLAREGGTGRLSTLAYGGGIAAAVTGLLIPGPDQVGALNNDDIDASGAAVLHHLADAFFIATEYVLPILMFATAIVALRYGAFPKWLGWFSVLIGIVLLIGPIGWAALIFAFPIWVLIVSVLLWRWAESPTGHREHAPAPA